MKTFRISKNQLSKAGEETFHPMRCRIEQRYSLFYFIKWWGTPSFAPPHYFENDNEAAKAIWDKYPNAVIIDNYSGNQCKG